MFILLFVPCPIVPYDSLDDLYYDAEDDLDNDISEDIPEYSTPVFISRPHSIVSIVDYN